MIESIDFYWRPGCLYCVGLRRTLERFEIPYREHNIWEDPGAATFVREATGGDETVPTVAVGGRTLVNPTGRELLRAVEAEAPGLLPDGLEVPPPGLVERLLSLLAGPR